MTDSKFMALAQLISSWSKDPRTKVGCVIVRPDRTIASTGFNGFPRKLYDDPKLLEDRKTKHRLMIHAEQNALLFARERLDGYTLYVTIPPCPSCAVTIIQAGISRVVANPFYDQDAILDYAMSATLFAGAGVAYEEVQDS